jgi:hypothetical protein
MQNPDGGWAAYARASEQAARPHHDGAEEAPAAELLRDSAGCGARPWSWATRPPKTSRGASCTPGPARLHHRAPAIRKAVAFLRDQQRPDGAWWGRWEVNYVPATARVPEGSPPWAQTCKPTGCDGPSAGCSRARTPTAAGAKMSSPTAVRIWRAQGRAWRPSPGWCLRHLSKSGSELLAARRAVRYLLRQQCATGGMARCGHLSTLIPRTCSTSTRDSSLRRAGGTGPVSHRATRRAFRRSPRSTLGQRVPGRHPPGG